MNSDDELDKALPGLQLLHELHFGAPDWRAVSLFADRLHAAGGRFSALTLRTSEAGMAVRRRVRGVSASAARSLIATLLGEGVIVGSSGVEHLMLARECAAPDV